MKKITILFVILLIMAASIFSDLSLTTKALPPGNCVDCVWPEAGNPYCQFQGSGYINCDQTPPNCITKTQCN